MHIEGKEGNVLFNDTLNTFYLWLYVSEMYIKAQTNSKLNYSNKKNKS